MDVEMWIFITAGCLFSCCVGAVATYVAVNWSRDRQEEADQQRRENAIEHGLKLAQDVQQLEQRISGDTPTVDLYDGEAERCEVVPETGSVLHRYACDFGPDCPAPGGHVDPVAFAASVGREHAAIQPPAMTGDRDVDAQDRELTDIYGIDETTPLVGPCQRCGTEAAMCTHLVLSEGLGGCCGACASGLLTHCPEKGGCRRPEQCETGCHWLRLRALNQGVSD